MGPVKDIVMLLMSLSALNPVYRDYGHVDYEVTEEDVDEFSPTADTDVASSSRPYGKSLYDLLEHFPVDEDFECPESDCNLRYPGECSRYITCKDFKAHIRSCPPGMYFDPKSAYCRLAFQVDCKFAPKEQYECDPNEIYSDCGSPCEDNCDHLPPTIECEDECYVGCFCRMGYIRDINGKCVKPGDCQNANSILSFLGV